MRPLPRNEVDPSARRTGGIVLAPDRRVAPLGIGRLAFGLLPAAVGALAFGIAAWVVRPFNLAPVGFDTAASVLHFDRILAGRRLESFVTTTPKPFVTVVDGLIHGVTGDWRFVSWAAIAAFVAVAVLATLLAWRVSGPLAAAFAGVALAGSPPLLSDVAIAYAVVWAVLCWAIAAFALIASPRRYGLAGCLLMLAALARFEAFVVTGIAVTLVLVLRFLPRIPAARRPPGRAFLLAVGFLALPIMLLHDWLLTGDPWFWTTVSGAFSASASQYVMTPAQLIRWLAHRYVDAGPITLLALVGIADLAWRGRRSVDLGIVAAGLLAVAGGILGFLVLLAVRRTYVSDRYPLPVDVVLEFAAGLGLAAIARAALLAVPRLAADRALPLSRPQPPSGPGAVRATEPAARAAWSVLIVFVIGAVAAVVTMTPYGPLDRSMRNAVTDSRDMNGALDQALPVLREQGYALSTAAERSLPLTYKDSAPPPTVIVPVLLRPRAAVDLGLPLFTVGSGTPIVTNGGAATIARPMVLMHLSRDDAPPDRYRMFETSTTIQVGRVRIVPLLVRQSEGLWVVRLEPLS